MGPGPPRSRTGPPAANERQRGGRTLSRNRVLACVALLAATAVVTVDVLARGPLTRLDQVVHQQLGTHVHGALWWVAYGLAQFGNELILLPLLGVLCLVAAARHRSFRPIVVTFVVCATLASIVPVIKILTGRTAPGSGFDAVFAGGTEYPSGHAVNAIVIWGLALEMLVVAFPFAERWFTVRCRRVLVVLGGAAGAVGMVGLDYHWFTDALGGWLLGAAMFVVILGLGTLAPLRARARAVTPSPATAPRPTPRRAPPSPAGPAGRRR